MRKNRLASFSIAATTLLTLGGAGCGDLKDIADELRSHGGGSSTGSGGTTGTSTPGCDYEGKTFPLGSSFPSSDGCNVCSCDKTGVACTLKACSAPPPAQSCEKIPVTADTGACVSYETWKIQLGNGSGCPTGESLSSLTFASPCEDGASTREVIMVCCNTPPANDVVCRESADAATGAPCTVCTDASGTVVKSSCGTSSK